MSRFLTSDLYAKLSVDAAEVSAMLRIGYGGPEPFKARFTIR